MGFMCSWIAVKGVSKDALLASIGMVETDGRHEVFPAHRQVNFCVSERPNGWTVLFSEDIDWASHERILELSRLGPAVGLQFEDKVEMESIATGAENGVELWRVYHSNDPKKPELDVRGTPPSEFAGIRDGLLKEREDDDGDGPSCDYLHDIPLETAKAACGYRTDEVEEPFTALKPIGADDGEAAYGRRREPFFRSLFGLFKRK